MKQLGYWCSIAAIVASVAVACSTEDADGPTPSSETAGDSGLVGGGPQGGSGPLPAGGAGGARAWTCDSGYDLNSYHGDTAGLCAADESRWIECCPDDISHALTVVCAPDGSTCVSIDGAYCTTYDTSTECGWLLCDPENQLDAAGGAGGAGATACPWEKAMHPELLVPCASDVHCEGTHQVCNRRIANRMFCGDPNGSAQGGASQ